MTDSQDRDPTDPDVPTADEDGSEDGRDRGATPPEWVVLPPADVVAAVATGAVPDIALDALRSVIVPVLGPTGAVVDWELTFTGPISTASVAAYWRWRRHWETRWALGDVAQLDALRERAPESDVALAALLDALVAAPDEPVAVDARFGDEVLPSVAALRRDLLASSDHGTALVDDMPHPRHRGNLRAWVPPPDEVMVAATTTTSLWLHPDDGLVLVGASLPAGRCEGIVAYDALGKTVVVRTADGEEARLAPLDARPLAWLAPTCLRWRSAQVPIAAVFERTFDGLPAAFAAASRSGAPVRLTSDVPIV